MDNSDPAVTPSAPSGPAALPKADLVRRAIALIIDSIVAGLIAWILGIIPGVGDTFGAIVGGLYILLRDGLDTDYLRHRSLGKTLMNLRPVARSGAPVDLGTSLRRNWTLALGPIGTVLWFIPLLGWLAALVVWLAGPVIGLIEVVLVLTDPEGRRLGDRLAGTQVVETAMATASTKES